MSTATDPTQPSSLNLVHPIVLEEDVDTMQEVQQMIEQAQTAATNSTSRWGNWWYLGIRVTMIVLTLAVFALMLVYLVQSMQRALANDGFSFTKDPSLAQFRVGRLRSKQVSVCGVTIAGWLVADYSMSWDSPLWQGVPEEIAKQGEYKTMEFLGHEEGDLRFQQHREAWFRKQDLEEMAHFGLNMLTVPVGFWIVGNHSASSSTGAEAPWRVYAPGALAFLDLLINEWAIEFAFPVMLSLHAHPGSQNGRASSAPKFAGQQEWDQDDANLENSVQFATFLAQRYRNAAAFVGLSLLHEPASPINMTKVQQYYERTYKAIRDSGNDCVIVIPAGLPWGSLLPNVEHPKNMWQDWHPSFASFQNPNETESGVLDTVEEYGIVMRKWSQPNGSILLGEWSLASPRSAPFDGCDRKREFGRKQLQAFQDANATGWVFTSWRHANESNENGSAWSLRQNLRRRCVDLDMLWWRKDGE